MSKTIPFKLSKTSNLMNKILLHITDNEIRIKNNNNEIIINENGMNINNILHIKEQTITNVDSTNGLIGLKEDKIEYPSNPIYLAGIGDKVNAIAVRAIVDNQKNKRVHLLFYGGARKIGDNGSFYYASLNVLADYKKYYPNDIYIHKFVDSAKSIVDTINNQEINSIASLDLFFHGSKWGLYIYKSSSMSKSIQEGDIEKYNLNAGLYASKTAKLTSTNSHLDIRTIYDIEFNRFINKGAIIEIHGCESGGDLYIIDSITKNLSEELPKGYIIGHITKANPNIDNTRVSKKQDYRHGRRAIWHNGKVVLETSQKRWLNIKELLK